MNSIKESISGEINWEACVWISKIHDAPLSAADELAFKQWLGQSPAHKNELRRMAKRWDELNILTELAVPLSSQQVTNTNSSYGFWAGLTASMATVLFVGFLFFFSGPASETGVYSTAIGEQRLVTLSDHSTVLLNTNSAIQVRYSKDVRSIQLMQGEALFDVSSNPDRPFKVQAGKSVVLAIGTAFSVHIKKESVDVIVTEGIVGLSKLQDYSVNGSSNASLETQERAVITAGQSGSFNQRSDTIELVEDVTESMIDRKLSWREGLVKFSGVPLEEVVEEISRYTALKIVILDPDLRGLRVGGLFKVGETDKMFEALALGFGVNAEYVNDSEVHLKLLANE